MRSTHTNNRGRITRPEPGGFAGDCGRRRHRGWPYLFTGLRLGLARGLVGIVVADLFASAGLGYMIFTAVRTFRTDQLFVAVCVLAILGLIFTVVLRKVTAHLMPWWRPYDEPGSPK